jgi:HSP20 family protein
MSIIPKFLSSCKNKVVSLSNSLVEQLFDVKYVNMIRIDLWQTQEAYVFKVVVPGVKKEDMKIEIEEDDKRYACILVIKTNAKKDIIENEENNGFWHLEERLSGKFERRFKFHKIVMIDQINASLENGVLTIIVPKMVPKAIKIYTSEGTKGKPIFICD